ncbi:MAG: hypothetical protein KDD12_10285, partial [Lewinella sp.]|nr:hypothetical protein [Lewinella sp.]
MKQQPRIFRMVRLLSCCTLLNAGILPGQTGATLNSIRLSEANLQPLLFTGTDAGACKPVFTHPLVAFQVGEKWLDAQNA